jgi:zinc/manganese transport system ATP-binding protein
VNAYPPEPPLRADAPELLTPAGAGEERAGEQVLAVRDLRVSLGGREILKGVDFDIRAGEFTGLIGSNGAGKTTLLRVILGLQSADSGQIVVGGTTRGSGNGDRHGLGYVPQKFLLDPDMPLRARDVVALGLEARRLGPVLPSRARRERVQAALEAVGALAFADARVGRLSGGEQQRVLIAHALISEPRLLLLDEPLANLDPHSTREVVDVLARLTRKQGVAVLISAHEINPLLPFMDRIVYLAGGRSASGTAAEVVRSDVLSRLYGDHVDVLRVHGRVLVVTGAADRSAEKLDEAEHAREIQVVS